jgi:hypothetical protein
MQLFLMALLIGFVVLVLLLLFTNYATDEPEGLLSNVGHMVGWFWSFPLIIFYWIAGRPTVLALVLTALFDIIVISLPVYLLLRIFYN